MKCGEIWARSARSSAFASRSDCCSSSASSSWARDEARSLGDRAGVVGGQAAAARVQGHERADPLAGDDQRRDDAEASWQFGFAHLISDSTCSAVITSAATRPESRSPARMVIGADPVEREHPLTVGERHRRGLRQRPQMHHRLRRGLGRQPLAQLRQRDRGGMQGPLDRVDLAGDHRRRPKQPEGRQTRSGDRPAEQYTEKYVHSTRSIFLAHATSGCRSSQDSDRSPNRCRVPTGHDYRSVSSDRQI